MSKIYNLHFTIYKQVPDFKTCLIGNIHKIESWESINTLGDVI